MKRTYTYEELLHKAAAYCSLTEHCKQEVKDKLNMWGANPTDSGKILHYLCKEDYINETRYCKYFVKDKYRFNKWGKMKIGMALRAKGLEEEQIQAGLENIDEDEYDELLSTLLQTKLKGLKYKTEYEKNGKLFRFAQSRGFETKKIEQAIKNFS
jgi:regulatory protein